MTIIKIRNLIFTLKSKLDRKFLLLFGPSMYNLTDGTTHHQHCYSWFFFLEYIGTLNDSIFPFFFFMIRPKKKNCLFPVTRPSLIKTSRFKFFYDFARPYFFSFIFARPIFFLSLAIAADPLSFDNMQLSNHRE